MLVTIIISVCMRGEIIPYIGSWMCVSINMGLWFMFISYSTSYSLILWCALQLDRA